ncbi:16S rRNA (uracil(1498)-N(3))-methyltransferase [Paenibacillus selenitireducens]|uniref:Ribosomal RNA small subunit methyltransferase E n=1 Tax=Paenibacillus selenitireducens TaxID=1324314 RepID=A0A1T2XFK3_9BACL|nr:RsmE family RNA methyltransferase [Paenibacillus selenitireducens]OPA78393.1 16S rRNA (uracil(1498)-N(3))-methyltransferase [Paenibacillus selenitireducens]
MQRYFIPSDQFGEHTVMITGDDAHHISKVMRARVGEKLIVSDGADKEALVEIVDLAPNGVEASIVEMRALTQEAWMQVTVAQSLPKGDKMETVIQKCTEIGAIRFIPYISERTIVQYDAKKEAKRVERWGKIAKEAAEQAHRNRVPEVESTSTWKQLLARFGSYDLILFCYEKEEGLQLRSAVQPFVASYEASQPPQVLLLVGPEGGFTVSEMEAAEAAGAQSVGLGKRILRTETAAMVGLTCLFYESGEMGGV